MFPKSIKKRISMTRKDLQLIEDSLRIGGYYYDRLADQLQPGNENQKELADYIRGCANECKQARVRFQKILNRF